MSFLILFFSCLMDVIQTILAKKSSKGNDMKFMLSFNFFKGFSALLVLLLLMGKGASLNIYTLVMGVIYGLLLLSSMCTSFIALNCGNMAVTAIVISYSVIIPFIFGGLILKEPVSALKIYGLLLLLISILLMNYNKSGKGFAKVWAICTFSCFVTNGLCSVVQKLHQTAYPGQYLKEFMAVAFTVITFVLSVMLLLKYRGFSKDSRQFAVISGICTGGVCLLQLYLASVFSATVLYPTIAVCGALLNCFASRLVFKDKLRKLQICAVVLGIVSVILIQ